MEQEIQHPQVLRVNKEDYIHGMLAGTFDTSKLAKYPYYVSLSKDYDCVTYQQLEHHKTCDLMYLEYENPNGTLDLEIYFELSNEFILFLTHEAYMHIQQAEGWFRVSQNCNFKENPLFKTAK